ncbi:2 3-dihydroxybiphenyl-1 2-dioxygenase [Fusarium mundagurra]|uniref:2 3-dihydroxybiphenyl-1 2-dioxygenase n=1 Tax=Fusarium mundagurra TaxID=1567541 RepID=A0A8H5XXL7_9HYPO|nr:2 3-dihydroxybiphenyl-1 2-dioxygenase [Fusarium mundagurra]
MASAEKIKVLRLVAVHYQHPDLKSASAFLRDFGLAEVLCQDKRIYFGGYGCDPYLYIAEQSPDARRAFLGGTWAVNSLDDLSKAAAIPGASAILDAEGPGGGKKVTVPDPNGFPITFIHGQELNDPQDDLVTRALDKVAPVANQAMEKPRLGRFLRFSKGPSPVHKLGHYGYIVPKDQFKKTFEWYTSLINFVPSDSVFNPETGDDSTHFMHIDLGETFTDHHASTSFPRTVLTN